MADYFSNLIQLSRGRTAVVQPRLAPLFAPGPRLPPAAGEEARFLTGEAPGERTGPEEGWSPGPAAFPANQPPRSLARPAQAPDSPALPGQPLLQPGDESDWDRPAGASSSQATLVQSQPGEQPGSPGERRSAAYRAAPNSSPPPQADTAAQSSLFGQEASSSRSPRANLPQEAGEFARTPRPRRLPAQPESELPAPEGGPLYGPFPTSNLRAGPQPGGNPAAAGEPVEEGLFHPTLPPTAQPAARRLMPPIQPENHPEIEPPAQTDSRSGRGTAALQPAARAQAPVIQVSIGRVEVRASLPAPPPSAPTPAATGPRMTLDEYLLAQKEGKR